MRIIITVLLMLLLSNSSKSVLAQTEPQPQQPSPAPHDQASSSSLVRSVTGCVVQSDHGFSLQTDSDSFPLETDQDLSQYVNKQVQVTGVMEEDHTGPAPSARSGSSAVIRDFRLRMIATVIGDCDQAPK